MTPAEYAAQRARDYVRDRGWRHEPLSWEEVAELIERNEEYFHVDDVAARIAGAWEEVAELIERDEEYFHVDDVAARIAGVTMYKTSRLALAKAFGVEVADLTPRAVL